MTLTSKINDAVSPAELVEYYIGTPDKVDAVSYWFKCPIHHEKTASFRAYREHNRGYYCFGCKSGGNCIQFVMRLFDIDFMSAARKIDNDFKLGIINRRYRKQVQPPTSRQVREKIEQVANNLTKHKEMMYNNLPMENSEYKVICKLQYLATRPYNYRDAREFLEKYIK